MGGGYLVFDSGRWAAALLAVALLITEQQRRVGLSTVGTAHLLAVDWLGWVCYITSFVSALYIVKKTDKTDTRSRMR